MGVLAVMAQQPDECGGLQHTFADCHGEILPVIVLATAAVVASAAMGGLITSLLFPQIMNAVAGVNRSLATAESASHDADSVPVENAHPPSGAILHHSEADPLRRHGPAHVTHPQEWEASIQQAQHLGVQVELRRGGIAYGPSPTPGHPGTLTLDPDSSIGALRHEMQHVRDDHAVGWGGMRYWFSDPHVRYQGEVRAYQVEIEYALSIEDHSAVEALTRLLEQERRTIFGGGSDG